MFFDQRNDASVGITIIDGIESGHWDPRATERLSRAKLHAMADAHYDPDSWTPGNYSSPHWWRNECERILNHYLPYRDFTQAPASAIERTAEWMWHDCGDLGDSECDGEMCGGGHKDASCCECAAFDQWFNKVCESCKCHRAGCYRCWRTNGHTNYGGYNLDVAPNAKCGIACPGDGTWHPAPLVTQDAIDKVDARAVIH